MPEKRDLRELKELYITFNQTHDGNPQEAYQDLLLLIEYYRHCDERLFRDFSNVLNRYKTQIAMSFTFAGGRRLSNGVMEGFNCEPKDLKRISRGFDNFEFARQRIIWANRKDAPILGKPKTLKKVQTRKTNPRGPYKK